MVICADLHACASNLMYFNRIFMYHFYIGSFSGFSFGGFLRRSISENSSRRQTAPKDNDEDDEIYGRNIDN